MRAHGAKLAPRIFNSDIVYLFIVGLLKSPSLGLTALSMHAEDSVEAESAGNALTIALRNVLLKPSFLQLRLLVVLQDSHQEREGFTVLFRKGLRNLIY